MIELVPASANDKAIMLNLHEYYVYDFSALLDLDIGADGRFGGQRLERHFDDPLCHPFFIRVDGQLAGFALHETRSRLTGAPGINDVAEFFVMRRFRERGVGAAAACALFDRFAGAWEVRQIPANAAATVFWRKVIARYTGGAHTEITWDDDRFRGIVQRFVSAGIVRNP
jgi:predicted acetyltransferase